MHVAWQILEHYYAFHFFLPRFIDKIYCFLASLRHMIKTKTWLDAWLNKLLLEWNNLLSACAWHRKSRTKTKLRYKFGSVYLIHLFKKHFLHVLMLLSLDKNIEANSSLWYLSSDYNADTNIKPEDQWSYKRSPDFFLHVLMLLSLDKNIEANSSLWYLSSDYNAETIIKLDDQWSYKRSPDYWPGITTTMKSKKHCCKNFFKIHICNSKVIKKSNLTSR